MLNTLKSQVMKRQMIIGLMLAAAFTLTNCSEQLVSPEKEQINVDENIENSTPQEDLVRVPYEVYVSNPDTKTISNGSNTYWVDEATAIANGLTKDDVDKVTIYTKAGTQYTRQGRFTYAGNQRFVGEVINNSLDHCCPVKVPDDYYKV